MATEYRDGMPSASGPRNAILGLRHVGSQLAERLAADGVELLLADPYTFNSAPRLQDTVARRLTRSYPGVAISGFDGADLTRDAVVALARDGFRLVCCFGRSFLAASYWANDAVLAQGGVAVFADLSATQAVIGPLVVPGRTACYKCYRLRRLACVPDPDTALDQEERDYGRVRPDPTDETVPQTLAERAAARIADLVRSAPEDAGPVGAVDLLRADDAVDNPHSVLPHPFCPACNSTLDRAHPTISHLTRDPVPPLASVPAEQALRSRHSGLIERIEQQCLNDTGQSGPFFAAAWLSNFRFESPSKRRTLGGGGKGWTREAAVAGAIGEACEAYASRLWTEEEIVRARRGQLDGPSLHPSELVLFAPEQYRDVPFAPYEETTEIDWMPGLSLVSGQSIFVPALAVFMNHRGRHPRERICPGGSTGLGVGGSLGEAVLSGLCEVLERDAFLLTWLRRLPVDRIDLDRFPVTHLQDYAARQRKEGIELELCRLPVDHPAAAMLCLSIDRRGDPARPAATIGLGCHPSPARAASAAVLEAAQARMAMTRRFDDRRVREKARWLADNPGHVADMDDHSLRYGDPRSHDAFAFLLERPAVQPDMPGGSAAEPGLSALVQVVGELDHDIIYVNLTPPDLEAVGLFAARVIVGGFQPMHFGIGGRRLGGRRLWEMPRRLGLGDGKPDLSGLNPDPHPLG